MRGLLRRVQRRFRSARMREFESRFRIDANTRILDVGGTPTNWGLLSVHPRVTLLNNEQEAVDRSTVPEHFSYVVADARALPFADGAFDIVYSNSVIEHVGSTGAKDGRARSLHNVRQCLASFRASLDEHLEAVDVPFAFAGDGSEIPHDLGIILIEVFDLAGDRFVDMLLESEHIRDVTVDGFAGAARHVYSPLK